MLHPYLIPFTYMKKQIPVIILCFTGIFFYSVILYAQSVRPYTEAIHTRNTAPAFEYKIIAAPDHTWGYDILKDHKVFIHQPGRPGFPGKQGFKTKEDASKVARLVIAKIKKGEMPPSVSQEELTALKLKN